MTEYWKSTAKYYCKTCNCYIADNKASRLHHDTSNGHKFKTEQALKLQRQQKQNQIRDEHDLKKQLADIEKAARVAVQEDRQHGYISQAGSNLPKAPTHTYGSGSSSFVPRQPPANLPAQEAEDDLEEDNTGVYTIRGTTYLDGKKFEERLKSGVKSQIFVENLDEWFDVETLVRKETAIPHTNVVLKTFNATYSIPDEASGVSKSVTETGLKSDRFRIVADEKDLQGETNEAASIAGVPAAPKVDEYTGVGGWQTVTVREVDEEKEHEEYEKNIEAIRKGEYQEEKEELDWIPKGPKETVHYKEAYYANKPRIYKGVLLDDSKTVEKVYIDNDDDEDAGPVTFKKRKRPANSGGRIRSSNDVAESKDDEDDIPAKFIVKEAVVSKVEEIPVMNKPSNVTAQNVAVQETNKESDAVMPSKQETQTEKAAVGLVFKSKPRNIRKSFNTEDE